jgi:ABC-2 type transport system ATP-binding protein
MLELLDLSKSFRRGAAGDEAGRRSRSRSADRAGAASPERATTTQALDRLSLSVAPGRAVGFVGANGSGKTTAMRIALGVLAPDSGEVRVDGRPATSEDRRRFGYMPEERGLYPKMRVSDQISYLARLHGFSPADAAASTQRWLERLEVSDRSADRVESLSLGNQQRVQLAAALVHQPQYLVLDEPFSGLDPLGVDVMTGVLGEAVREGAGVVFSSHQLELVERICDEVVIIRAGRVVAAGTVAELSAGRRRSVAMTTTIPPQLWLPPDHDLLSSDAVGDVHESVVGLPDGTDASAAVAAAVAVGAVLACTPVETRLSDIFREVVAS